MTKAFEYPYVQNSAGAIRHTSCVVLNAWLGWIMTLYRLYTILSLSLSPSLFFGR